MTNCVDCVLGVCAPNKISRVIIQLIAVQMTNEPLPLWHWAMEGFAHEAMNATQALPAGNVNIKVWVTFIVKRRSEKAKAPA